MDYALDDAQSLLRDSARAFLEQRFSLAELQSLAVAAPVPDLWAEMSELGWNGLLIDESHGGSGGDVLDACILVEQMGYACLPSPFIHSAVVAAAVLTRFGTPSQQASWLPVLANGQARISVALAETSGEYTLDAMNAGGAPGQSLAGTKLFVKDADTATGILVALRQDGAACFAIVPPSVCKLEPMPTLSGESLFALTLDGVRVEDGNVLDGGEAAVEWAVTVGALARSAEMVGLAQRVLDIVVEHVSVREQSGQPIGAFQAIAHSAADMLRNVSGARDIVYRAGWELSEGHTEKGAEFVSMAKAYAGEMCMDTVRRGHQMMGAIGYCEEHPLHILHKRIQAAGIEFGDARSYLDRIARDMGLAAA